MTSLDGENELKQFRAEQRAKKKAYCATLGLFCNSCPQDKSGCEYHPNHQEAVKNEAADYDVAG